MAASSVGLDRCRRWRGFDSFVMEAIVTVRAVSDSPRGLEETQALCWAWRGAGVGSEI